MSPYGRNSSFEGSVIKTKERYKMKEMFNQYKPLISKKVKEAWLRSGLEIEDLYGEAHVLFCQAYNNFDPAKGAFSTLLWQYLSLGLSTSIMKEKKHPVYEEVESVQAKDHSYSWSDFLHSLSQESKNLVSVIYKTPQAIGEKLNKQTVKLFLQKEGYSYRKIDKIFGEIKTNIRSYV